MGLGEFIFLCRRSLWVCLEGRIEVGEVGREDEVGKFGRR
jgi:hypothetical protein